ncbi:expressed protein [Dictyostelium purpureum]|uniref:Expressed protein n=1 Tax=Dictyostelium purpureum TaxID=5786 RepID=F0ZFT4_DICPU|nr:uncharacterized protein DICPUDRAFT_150235 [Dictyostelium purpureum]EGC37211.1 expressed protein [Dictyostelium purpureum]|eukprot:XP_003286262.1 expressed protein [Dictyostelium purpureum]
MTVPQKKSYNKAPFVTRANKEKSGFIIFIIVEAGQVCAIFGFLLGTGLFETLYCSK